MNIGKSQQKGRRDTMFHYNNFIDDFEGPRGYHRETDRNRDRGFNFSPINSDEEGYLEKKDDHRCHKHKHQANKSEKVQRKIEPPVNEVDKSDRLDRIEKLLEKLIKHDAPSHSNLNLDHNSDFFPKENSVGLCLEPRKQSFTTSMWINKIQEICLMNNWNEKTTIKYMETQLTGILKAWYNSLPHYNYSWPEWKMILIRTFPDNDDFITSLKRLVTRIKHPDETVNNYYFSKMYLIEACKITGMDAVSCLIDGLNNQSIQSQAKLLNHLTPETLYSQFLVNLPEYAVDYTPNSVPNEPSTFNWQGSSSRPKNSVEMQNSIDNNQNNFQNTMNENLDFEYGPNSEFVQPTVVPFEPPPTDLLYESEKKDNYGKMQQGNKNNYNQQQRVRAGRGAGKKRQRQHLRNQTIVRPKIEKDFSRFYLDNRRKSDKICSICFGKGHIAAVCTMKKMKLCKLGSIDYKNCYYKNCYINNKLVSLKSFIDTGCNTVTLRLKEAEDLNIKFETCGEIIEGFGGARTKVLGRVVMDLQVDSVEATLPVMIVPNEVQDVPIIIGQPLLNDPNVLMIVQNDYLRLLQISPGADVFYQGSSQLLNN